MKLAPRYRHVLAMLSQGMTYVQVAEQLGVAPSTAWQYISDVFIKSDTLRPKLAAYALSLLDDC